jgi:glycosyltransferase involved in cell wall biosynthesis
LSLVSVIIPAYNSARHIGECLESVIKQTYEQIEIVLVDDGSTDNTVEILQEILRTNQSKKSIEIITQPNRGACSARNKGLRNCKGDYIQFLDADDILCPDKISVQVDLAQKYGDAVVFSGQWDRFHNHTDECSFPERGIYGDWQNTIDWLVHSWEGNGMGQTGIWLCPREIIEKAGYWNEELSINQDGEFFSRVLLNADGIRYADESKVYYRSGNTSSISNQQSLEKAKSLLISYLLYKKNVIQFINKEKVRHGLMMNLLRFIYQYYESFPDLVRKAKAEIIQLGYTQLEITGGKNFRRIANILGFENTLKLRKVIKGIVR